MSLRIQSIVRIAAWCFALCAALGATPTARAQQPNEIKFGGMPLGSIWYVFAASFSKYSLADPGACPPDPHMKPVDRRKKQAGRARGLFLS